jgi:hypothetical protein
MEDRQKYEMMQTKVSKETYDALKRIERKQGISIYSIIQNMCDCIRRYTEDRTRLSPMVEKAMNMLEHMIGWKDNFNVADPNADPEISEATYYLNDKNGKKGIRVVHVERPFFGEWKQTMNLQQILERFMCLTFPSLYRRLRFIAVCRECSSILELLIDIVGELEREEDKRDLAQPFEDAQRSDYGKAVEYGQRTRRKKHQDMDSLFDKEDQ